MVMATFTGVRQPKYAEGQTEANIRELYAAFKALQEQMIYTLQNIDEDNGAASTQTVEQLEQTVNRKLQAVNGSFTQFQQTVSALTLKVDEAAEKTAAITATSDGVVITVSDDTNTSKFTITPAGVVVDTPVLVLQDGELAVQKDDTTIGGISTDNGEALKLYTRGDAVIRIDSGGNDASISANTLYISTKSGTTSQ